MSAELRRRGEQRARLLGELGRSGEQGAVGAEHGGVDDVGGEGAQVLERLRRVSASVMSGAMLPAVPLSRIAWLTTVAICLITCVLLLLSGYLGYAGVLLAVAISAAINLR